MLQSRASAPIKAYPTSNQNITTKFDKLLQGESMNAERALLLEATGSEKMTEE